MVAMTQMCSQGHQSANSNPEGSAAIHEAPKVLTVLRQAQMSTASESQQEKHLKQRWLCADVAAAAGGGLALLRAPRVPGGSCIAALFSRPVGSHAARHDLQLVHQASRAYHWDGECVLTGSHGFP